jgi:hypothetical protein
MSSKGWSRYKSENSTLSICSDGSVLSIDSVGFTVSIVSIGLGLPRVLFSPYWLFAIWNRVIGER